MIWPCLETCWGISRRYGRFQSAMVSAELQPHRAGVWAKQSSGHPHSMWGMSTLLLLVLCSHLVPQGPEGCAGSPCCHSQGEYDLGALAELGGCVPVGPAWIVPWAFPWGHCVHAYHREPVLVSCGGPHVCASHRDPGPCKSDRAVPGAALCPHVSFKLRGNLD